MWRFDNYPGYLETGQHFVPAQSNLDEDLLHQDLFQERVLGMEGMLQDSSYGDSLPWNIGSSAGPPHPPIRHYRMHSTQERFHSVDVDNSFHNVTTTTNYSEWNQRSQTILSTQYKLNLSDRVVYTSLESRFETTSNVTVKSERTFHFHSSTTAASNKTKPARNRNVTYGCEQGQEKRASSGSELRVHTEWGKNPQEHTNKPFTCKFCGKSFRSRFALSEHQTRHTMEEKYQCAKCNQRFTTLNKLHYHHRLHLVVQPYVCSVCSKGFLYKSQLDRHVQTHLPKVMFNCETCGKKCPNRHLLHLHQVDKHNVKPENSCPRCRKILRTKRNLDKHQELCNAKRS